MGGGVKQELPVDLIFEILTKLPVKSLYRFRCVSKLWHSLTADPRFVDAHHACFRPPPEFLIILCGPSRITGEQMRHVFTCKLDSSMELHSPDHRGVTHTYLDFKYGCRGFTSHQAGGLYCIDLPDFVRFWNPTTREALDIKIPEAETNPPHSISTNHLGFDPVEKKHKVLNILTEYTGGKVIRSRVFILEDGCWRTTANAYPLHSVVPTTDMVICIDGVIFSVSHTADCTEQKLTAFHVRSETFQVIPAPGSRRTKTLIEFAGRAALVEFVFSGPRCEEGKVVLWMLEDLRKQVWRHKACVITGFDLTGLKLQCGTPTGELLFTGESSRHSFFLLLYNVESDTASKIEVQSLPELTRQQLRFVVPTRVYFHVESLMSPKRSFLLNLATHMKTLNI